PRFHASVVANRFVRCSGSRESIHSLIRRSCTVMQYRVSGSILCPLGQPNKAIGLKSQIGSWLALKPTLGLRSFATERRQAPLLHETVRSGRSTGFGIAAEIRGDPKR